MLAKTLIGLVALASLAAPSAVAAQTAAPPTVYTFVAEWQLPRSQWANFAADFDKTIRPVLEKLSSDGTLVGWGVYEYIVHSGDGYSHGTWWQATSYAAIERARAQLLPAGAASQALMAATGHRDYYLRTIAGNARSGSGSGYLTVSRYVVKPGQGQAWKQLWEKYNKALSDELVAKGTALGWSIDVEDTHTDNPGLRFVVGLSPSAEADDQAVAAFEAADAKLSPDEQKTRQLMMDNVLEPGMHRDLYARVIRFWAK
jgi:hypothetical protein